VQVRDTPSPRLLAQTLTVSLARKGGVWVRAPHGLLVVGTGLSLVAFTWAAGHWLSCPYDIQPGEGNHLYYTLRLLGGESLYARDTDFPYLYNGYPPLYYLVTAPLVGILGPHLLAGRLVSLAAALAAAVLIARWLRGAPGALPAAAAVGTLSSAATFVWFASFRADALAWLLGCGLLVAADALGRRPTTGGLVLLTILGVAASYTRQSNILLAIAAFASLWPAYRWRSVAALSACGAVCLAAFLLIERLTHGAFRQSVLVAFSWTHAPADGHVHVDVWSYLVSQGGWLTLGVIAAAHRSVRPAIPRAGWLGLLAAACQMAGTTRTGAATNDLLPLHFVLVAIGAKSASALAGRFPWGAAAASLVLAGQLASNAVQLLPLTRTVPAAALETAVRLERFLKGVRGPVLVERQVSLWLYTGRRDHFVEVEGLALAAHHGRWSPEPLTRFIDERGYSAILLRGRTLMPDRIRRAIAERYVLEARVPLWDDEFHVYRPAPDPPAAKNAMLR
jgi:hypothetical protein